MRNLAALTCFALIAACTPLEPETHDEHVAAESEAAKLVEEGDKVFNSRDYEKATEIFKQAVLAAEREKYNSYLTEALCMVARGYGIRDKREEGRPWLERGAKVAKDTEPRGWSRYLGVRGRFEWKDGKPDVAKQTFIAMYDYCMKHKLYDRAIDATHMVAIVAKPEEQVEWALKGIKAAEEGGHEGWLGPLWNNLGETYREMEKYPEMLDALLKAREYHYERGTDMNKLIADWAVASAYRLNKKLKEARELIDKTLAWAERLAKEKPDNPDGAEWIGWCKWELAEIEAAEDRKENALRLFNEAREALLKSGIEQWGKPYLAKLDKRIEELK